ncbi:hypothetical protein C5S35_07105 [Candidatus Methanophagaceae archaeon]|nr:hypothetical protein C5S35_07105 [Methanophagales archaeon]
MDKKDEGKEVRTLVGLVIVSGAALIIISFFIKGLNLDELHYLLRGLGISIIGGAIIAWAIGHLLSKAKFKKIYEDMQELNKEITATDENINVINENIRKSFKLIKESEDCGLLKIYEPFDMKCKKRDPSKEFKEDINELLFKEKKEIKIYGISLRLFFHDLGGFEQGISDAFERMNDNKVNIKVLLISPYSKWAGQRREAEEGFCDRISDDIIASIRGLGKKLGKYDKRGEMYDNIRFYDAAPDFFLFITSECVIFEIYHMGIFQLKRDRETHRGVQDLGLGGHVPAFQFDNSSSMYKYLDAHFDYFFEKEIEKGEKNKYHAGTLEGMRERLKKEPITKK